eukprot:gene1225-2698_t
MADRRHGSTIIVDPPSLSGETSAETLAHKDMLEQQKLESLMRLARGEVSKTPDTVVKSVPMSYIQLDWLLPPGHDALPPWFWGDSLALKKAKQARRVKKERVRQKQFGTVLCNKANRHWLEAKMARGNFDHPARGFPILPPAQKVRLLDPVAPSPVGPSAASSSSTPLQQSSRSPASAVAKKELLPTFTVYQPESPDAGPGYHSVYYLNKGVDNKQRGLGLFHGLVFYIAGYPHPQCPPATLVPILENHGAQVLEYLDDPEDPHATHVLIGGPFSRCVLKKVPHDYKKVTLKWVFDCLDKRTLLPVRGHYDYWIDFEFHHFGLRKYQQGSAPVTPLSPAFQLASPPVQSSLKSKPMVPVVESESEATDSMSPPGQPEAFPTASAGLGK